MSGEVLAAVEELTAVRRIFESQNKLNEDSRNDLVSQINSKSSELEDDASDFLATIHDRFKTTFYVSESGSDETGDGSSDSPFLTIGKALGKNNNYCQYLTLYLDGNVELSGATFLGNHLSFISLLRSPSSASARVLRPIYLSPSAGVYRVSGFYCSAYAINPTLVVGAGVEIEFPVPTSEQADNMHSDRYSALLGRNAGAGPAFLSVVMTACTLIRPAGCTGVITGGDAATNALAVSAVVVDGDEPMTGNWVAGYNDPNGTDVSSTKNVISNLHTI